MVLDYNKFIGIFDSGVGGISVLNECIKLMPNENFIFYADSDNFPYGIKPKTIIEKIGLKIINHFNNLKVKQVIIACNTMSTSNIELFTQTFSNMKIIGTYPDFTKIFVPGAIIAEKNIQYNKNDGLKIKKNKMKLLIIATTATCKSPYLTNLVSQFKQLIDIYIEPADFIVEAVENDQINTYDFKNKLEHFFKEYKDIDYLLLGCTHFLFAMDEIKKIVNNNAVIFSSAETTAKNSFKHINQNNIRNEAPNPIIIILDSHIDNERINLYSKLINSKTHKKIFKHSFSNL